MKKLLFSIIFLAVMSFANASQPSEPVMYQVPAYEYSMAESDGTGSGTDLTIHAEDLSMYGPHRDRGHAAAAMETACSNHNHELISSLSAIMSPGGDSAGIDIWRS